MRRQVTVVEVVVALEVVVVAEVALAEAAALPAVVMETILLVMGMQQFTTDTLFNVPYMEMGKSKF
ncbi:MAG: hypothetical protein LBV32_09705 [Tannerellaceae bacterium]|nr:hypothetical protein [Tannerellaceae bacterium]